MTIMPKDARLVAKIINIWEPGSFLSAFAHGTGDIYEQKLPVRKRKPRRPRRRDPNAPEPHYREKLPSKRKNSASNMTGGKAPNVRDKLRQRAARC